MIDIEGMEIVNFEGHSGAIGIDFSVFMLPNYILIYDTCHIHSAC